MTRMRRVLLLSSAALLMLSLSGLPGWLHAIHEKEGHSGHHCATCQLLRAHTAVEPGPAPDSCLTSDEVSFRVFESRGIPAPAVCCTLPPSRAPPVLS
jgi:hypothetical protein